MQDNYDTDAQSTRDSRYSWIRSFNGKSLALLAFLVPTVVIALAVGTWMGHMFSLSDAEWYIKIAQGDVSSVLQPFSSRQLAPLLVRGIGGLFHIDIYRSFVVEGVISILVMVTMSGVMLVGYSVSRLMLVIVGTLAFWAVIFNGLALPDVSFGAFLSVFLVLLTRDKYFACALMFFPLWVSREATILVLVAFLVAGIGRLRPLHYVSAFAASVAGVLVVHRLASSGLGNQERIGFFVYMIAKAPWNFLRNVLGIVPWSNVYPNLCGAPQWQIGIHFGRVTTVGVCGWDPAFPLWVLRIALTSFGVLPVLLVYSLRRNPRSILTDDVLLKFCFVYGAGSILLAPLIGVSVNRLFGYAWPLFIIAAPILATTLPFRKRRALWVLVPIHIAIAWPVLFHVSASSVSIEGTWIVLISCMSLIAWSVLGSSCARPPIGATQAC